MYDIARRVNLRYSLDEQYQYCEKISKIFYLKNPLQEFATRKKNEKFLGYGHVWLLSYGPLLQEFSKDSFISSNTVPFEHITRQGYLLQKKEYLQRILGTLDEKDKDYFFQWVQGVEYYISIQDYKQAEVAIMAFEKEFCISETILSDKCINIQQREHQIYGIFNAVVSTLSCLG